MRIALVCEHLETRRGGAETSTVQFAQHLLERGIEIELLTRGCALNRSGLRVHTLEGRAALRGLRSAAFARQADALLARLQPDLVHAVTPCLSADVYEPRGGALPESVARNLALRASAAGRALKRAANSMDLKLRTMLALERQLLTRPAPPWAVALSDYVGRQFEQHYGLARGNICKSFNGVDPPLIDEGRRPQLRREARQALDVQDREVLVLLAAHNFRLKGVGCWLRALARVAGPVRSVIVGRDRAAPYHRLARRLGVDGRVLFAGAQPDMDRFYAAADVLVHPTYYDPCSRVVLEALLWSLPCVTTRFNGAAEAIEDGITGRIIDHPEAIAALAAAVEEVAASSCRRALAERQPRLRIELSAARHTEDLIALYAAVLRERAGARPGHRQATRCAG